MPAASTAVQAGADTDAVAGSRLDRIIWATADIMRRHWLLWLLLAGGLVLRAVAQVAYEPARAVRCPRW